MQEILGGQVTNLSSQYFLLISQLYTSELFLRILLEIIRDWLIKTSCHSDTSASGILQEAVEAVELMEEVGDVLGESSQEHSAIGRIYLHHASIMLTNGARNLWIVQQDRGGNLEECHLMDKDLIIGIVITLHYIDFLLYRLVDFLYLLLIAPHGDSILVDVLDAAGRYIQALDIYLSAGEYRCNLIQDTSDILRVNEQCI